MKVRVDFFDSEHEEIIRNNNPVLHSAVKNKNNLLDLNSTEFLVYGVYMYQNKKFNRFLYRDMERDMPKKWGAFEEYFIIKESINIRSKDNDRTEVPEYIGVAGALCVISKLNRMTQADWTKLPVTSKHKDLDFSGFDINGRFLTVEAKGAFVDDNLESKSIINKKQSQIDSKKSDVVVEKRTQEYSGYNLGAIVLVDKSNPLRVILSDPSLDFSEDAGKLSLLKRLYFVLGELQSSSPSSSLTIALRNRVHAIEKSKLYSDFDSLSLVDGKGNELKSSITGMGTHAIVNGENYRGRYFTSGNYVYFIGLSVSLLNIVSLMNFKDILKFQVFPESSQGTLQIKFKGKDYQKILKANPNLKEKFERKHPVKAFSRVHLGSSGIALSRIKIIDL